ATSSINLFRAIGGSVGVAVFGALFNSRLVDALGGRPALRPEAVQLLPDAERAAYVADFAPALSGVFAYAVPVTALAVVLAVCLREVPLRTGVVPQPAADAELV
ncbi:MAG TPA: MFS transporter, partial [Acidimicrobiia bacterium]